MRMLGHIIHLTIIIEKGKFQERDSLPILGIVDITSNETPFQHHAGYRGNGSYCKGKGCCL